MIRYIITGERRERIPRDATHVSVHPSVTVIRARLFGFHPNIVELICHDGVDRIKEEAFWQCPRLKRVIILGVKMVEKFAFCSCTALEYVECPKLEIIKKSAFNGCKSLRKINLTCVKIVEELVFAGCEVLTEAKFGKELESIEKVAFLACRSLERITIPLKNGLITSDDDTFKGCQNLKRVDIVEGEVLLETAGTLLLEEWRNDMNAAIDSINHILPDAYAGELNVFYVYGEGEKATAIRDWISRVLHKIINYKAHHCQLLTEVASALQLALPNDIVTDYLVPFLELPFHKFDGEDEDEEDEEENNDSDDGRLYSSEDAWEEEDAYLNEGGDEDEQEREDGEDEEESGESEASINGEGHEEEEDDEGGGKRRKTANDH